MKQTATQPYCIRATLEGLTAFSWCGQRLGTGGAHALPVGAFLLMDEIMCASCVRAMRVARPGCETAAMKAVKQ